MTTKECIESLNLLLKCADDKLQGERDKMTKLVDLKPSSFEFVLKETIERLERHGRWIPIEYDACADGAPVWDKFECSECGHEHSGEEDTLTAFCPDCGSRMDGGADNDQG